MKELRLIRIHVDAGKPGKIGVGFELSTAVLQEGYRRHGGMRAAIAHLVEQALYLDVQAQAAIYGKAASL